MLDPSASQSIPTRDIPRTISLTNSCRCPLDSLVSLMSAVILPPGCAKLSMSPTRDRILNCHHDNRNRLGCLLGREDPSCSLGDKDIYLELHQFGHKAWHAVRFSLSR